MRRISPSLVLSIVAIVLACSGGAYATTRITGAQIKNSSITGLDIRNRSLTSADFYSPSALRGPQGPAGPAALSTLVRVESAQVFVSGGALGQATAVCPAGYGVVSGGYRSAGSDAEVFSQDSFGAANAWTALYDNFDSSVQGYIIATAYCSASGAAASPRSVGASSQVRIQQAIDEQQRSHQ